MRLFCLSALDWDFCRALVGLVGAVASEACRERLGSADLVGSLVNGGSVVSLADSGSLGRRATGGSPVKLAPMDSLAQEENQESRV